MGKGTDQDLSLHDLPNYVTGNKEILNKFLKNQEDFCKLSRINTADKKLNTVQQYQTFISSRFL